MKTNDINDFLKTFKILARNHNSWTVWQDYISLCACAISNSVDKTNYEKREQEYCSTIRKYDKQERRLFPKLFAKLALALENDPEQDFLGSIYMGLDFGNQYTGQFFTPYDICRTMAMMTIPSVCGHVNEYGFSTIHDPCCGAGATLIAGANVAKELYNKEGKNFQNYILFLGQDIDRVVGLMCYLQLSLLGCAGYIKIGDTLADPMQSNDDLSKYWFTPVYFTEIWAVRRALHSMDILMKSSNENG
ncbi:MAG: SAM-dependent methyltransferase [Clostridia bacterium]|nr:SAM-dependent methyltransferase [Clostridia bacterium]